MFFDTNLATVGIYIILARQSYKYLLFIHVENFQMDEILNTLGINNLYAKKSISLGTVSI